MSPLDTLGRPLRDLRISVTDRCNFRCPYCMPAEIFGERYEFLPREEILSFEEITRLARIFIGLGTEKIRITGGEPLLRREIERLIADLSAIPGLRDLTLTTNGVRFAALSETLKTAGLSRVTFSLDALDPDLFRKMAGRDESPDTVLNAIQKAEQTGYAPIKINTVISEATTTAKSSRLLSTFTGRTISSDSSSIWTSEHETAGRSITSSPPRKSSPESTTYCPSSPWNRTTSEKSRDVTAT